VSVKPSCVARAARVNSCWRLDRALPHELRSSGLQAPSRTNGPAPSTSLPAPSVSVPRRHVFAAAARRYLNLHFATGRRLRFVSPDVGCGLDEGNVGSVARTCGGRARAAWLWVVDLNRQSLTAVVPGMKVRSLEGACNDAGGRCLEVKYGSQFERPSTARRASPAAVGIDENGNDEYQALFGLPSTRSERPRSRATTTSAWRWIRTAYASCNGLLADLAATTWRPFSRPMRRPTPSTTSRLSCSRTDEWWACLRRRPAQPRDHVLGPHVAEFPRRLRPVDCTPNGTASILRPSRRLGAWKQPCAWPGPRRTRARRSTLRDVVGTGSRATRPLVDERRSDGSSPSLPARRGARMLTLAPDVPLHQPRAGGSTRWALRRTGARNPSGTAACWPGRQSPGSPHRAGHQRDEPVPMPGPAGPTQTCV